MGAWGDVCDYHNICFDGKHWIFLEDGDGVRHMSFSAPNDMVCPGLTCAVGLCCGLLTLLWTCHAAGGGNVSKVPRRAG